MNVQETTVALAMLQAAFPSSTVTEQTCEMWAAHLVGFTPQDGREAVDYIVDHNKFFPSIAEFRDAIRAVIRLRTGNGEGRTVENTRTLPELEESNERPTSHRSFNEQVVYNRGWLAEFKQRQRSRDKRILG